MTITEGRRVRVRDECHWAKGASGSAMIHPATKLLTRTVKALAGEKTFLWIGFDIGQIDADGDGPYYYAEIDLDFIERSK